MKSRIAHSAVPTFKYKVTRYLLEKEVVMNWSTLNKCILMLFLGSLIHVIWAIWKSVVLLTPELWRWVNLALLKQQLVINLFGLFVFISMIGICHYFRKQDWTRRYMCGGHLCGQFVPRWLSGRGTESGHHGDLC